VEEKGGGREGAEKDRVEEERKRRNWWLCKGRGRCLSGGAINIFL